MQIHHLEIANFRKLLAVRVDLAPSTTLLVGANNSGKSSAMLALRRFLVADSSTFRTLDITLCHFPTIDRIGLGWENADEAAQLPLAGEWDSLLPTLDVWLSANQGEVHLLRDLIPNFAWRGGHVGMRFRLEPKKIEDLYKDFRAERARAKSVAAEAARTLKAGEKQLTLWPSSLTDFLHRRLSKHFTVRWYRLDPSQLTDPDPISRMARPQSLRVNTVPLDSNPLKGLVRVHEINAQRGFGEVAGDEPEGEVRATNSRKLSEQLRTYYRRHLDPGDSPDITDLDALRAIEAAQDAFNLRLTDSFRPALQEVEGLGYPGTSDPKIRVATRLGAVDGMTHEAAVLFELESVGGAEGAPALHLPETSNGLGYQNLISMIFRLMSFRDSWLRRDRSQAQPSLGSIEPVHLVLIEEPEAHLHVQVQQVFVKHAYHVLCNDSILKDFPNLCTQMVVSTHSSHVAHEVEYACLRYFRRLSAGMNGVSIPVSTVSNLSAVFGEGVKTKEFVTRYLRAQHAELFFADAVILVEGAAERMMLPHFVRNHFKFLDQCYITVLDIGGSHAHRLRPLVDAMGLATLVITDLDAGTGGKAAPVQRGAGLRTNNPTLRSWALGNRIGSDVDTLLDINDDAKQKEFDDLYAIRVAYQTPVLVTLPKTGAQEEALPNTFEDALVLANTGHFASKTGKGLMGKFAKVLQQAASASDLGEELFNALREGDKAEFALSVLGDKKFVEIAIPVYIHAGLSWLEQRLRSKKSEMVVIAPPPAGV